MWKVKSLNLFICRLALVFMWPLASAMDAAGQIEKGEMAGYLLVPHEKVEETYNAGFSIYAAAWPLLEKYPGHRFQTGLFGTWMFAQYDGPAPPPYLAVAVETMARRNRPTPRIPPAPDCALRSQ